MDDCSSIASSLKHHPIPTGLKCLKNGWRHTWTVPYCIRPKVSMSKLRTSTSKWTTCTLLPPTTTQSEMIVRQISIFSSTNLSKLFRINFLAGSVNKMWQKCQKYLQHHTAHPGNHRRRQCQSELRGKGVCTNWEWLDRDSVSEEFLFHCNTECCLTWKIMNIHITSTKSVDKMFKPLQQLHSVPVWSCVVVQSKKAPIWQVQVNKHTKIFILIENMYSWILLLLSYLLTIFSHRRAGF